jgi:hypothetical protein
MRTLSVIFVFVLCLWPGAGLGRAKHPIAASGASTPPPFLTLLFSRTEVTAANRCVADNVKIERLDTVVAPELARRGYAGTGSVETGITPATGYGCVHYKDSLTASWAELAHLRDAYGWRFVSHSRTYAKNWSAMTTQQQWDQTCGSLLDLEKHGHMSGDGLFAYPDNKWDATVQANVVATCFAFGRQYGTGPTDMITATQPPYWQTSENLGGGRCNIKSLPCASIPNAPYRYDSPDAVAAQLAALAPAQWLTLQSYLLVRGSRSGMWDCTSSDWHRHWTDDFERYCYSDYLAVLNGIPASVVVTDPKTVAVAWGRTAYTPPHLTDPG